MLLFYVFCGVFSCAKVLVFDMAMLILCMIKSIIIYLKLARQIIHNY